MESKNKKYSPSQLAKMFDKKLITVSQRFNSKYAGKRWGVVSKQRLDGSIEKYVPESNLGLWKSDTKYVGRPVFRV
jgi:hypothetical protein